MNANATKRGPVGELLDHLLSELRQLDHRCAELEVLLHDLTIRHAAAGADPLLADEPRRGPKPAEPAAARASRGAPQPRPRRAVRRGAAARSRKVA